LCHRYSGHCEHKNNQEYGTEAKYDTCDFHSANIRAVIRSVPDSPVALKVISAEKKTRQTITDEVGKLAAVAGVKTLMLTHLIPSPISENQLHPPEAHKTTRNHVVFDENLVSDMKASEYKSADSDTC